MACAWATFLCYGAMMVISYVWGQKSYPVPYAWKKLLAYMVIVLLFYLVHHTITSTWQNEALNYAVATIFLFLFGVFIYRVERKEFENILKQFRNKPV
jgi:O-antigen/teichoic acid export membrane protein